MHNYVLPFRVKILDITIILRDAIALRWRSGSPPLESSATRYMGQTQTVRGYGSWTGGTLDRWINVSVLCGFSNILIPSHYFPHQV